MIVYEFPGDTLVTPRFVFTAGALLAEVCKLAGDWSWAKSIAPSPLKENEEVSNLSLLGKRKTREQRLPESEGRMSKLKIDEIVVLIVPLNDVPGALEGEELSIGMIK